MADSDYAYRNCACGWDGHVDECPKTYLFGIDTLSFTGFKGDPCVKVALPFGWGPVVDPDLGVLITHLVQSDRMKLMPRAVLGLAKRGEQGFKVVD